MIEQDQRIVQDLICGGHCVMPAVNRAVSKNQGGMYLARVKLKCLGPYTTGGYDLSELLLELGKGCVYGAFCLMGWDPYGCKIEPGVHGLNICWDDAGAEGCYENGVFNATEPKLQVFDGASEVADGWVAPADEQYWIGFLV